MQEPPLMWTCRGNVPVDSLRYEYRWFKEPKENGDTIIWLHEDWFFEDGTLARNNAHGYYERASNDVTIGLAGIGMGGEQAAM